MTESFLIVTSLSSYNKMKCTVMHNCVAINGLRCSSELAQCWDDVCCSVHSLAYCNWSFVSLEQCFCSSYPLQINYVLLVWRASGLEVLWNTEIEPCFQTLAVICQISAKGFDIQGILFWLLVLAFFWVSLKVAEEVGFLMLSISSMLCHAITAAVQYC